MAKIISVSAKVNEDTHRELRGLLVTGKLTEKTFTEWLQARESEAIKGKKK